MLLIMGWAEWAKRVKPFTDGVWQEPPWRANPLKHFCADEMFDLIESFSPTLSTGYVDGLFRRGAVLLYEGVTGECEADLKRACDWILRQRCTAEWIQRHQQHD